MGTPFSSINIIDYTNWWHIPSLQLNTTEAELIIQAIEENAGEKVLECIANKHNAAITNIGKAHTTFLSNLAEAQSSGDATINLAETIISVAAYDLPSTYLSKQGTKYFFIKQN